MSDESQDKLNEAQMAAYLGITIRALRTRRHRGQIPFGVWNKVGRETYYSIRRYQEWLESNWACPQASNSSESPSVSDSVGKAQIQSGDAKHSPCRKRRKVSQPPQRYVIRLEA